MPPAGAQCTVVGTVATCTGDLRTGVDANAPLTVLNVHSLTQNITPAGGADGIDFFSAAGDLSINVDTGAFVIATTGDNADGFEVFEGGVGGPGDVTITSTGNISTQGGNADGFNVFEGGDGNSTITLTGNISTMGDDADGFDVVERGAGNITITSSGNISTLGSNANGFEVTENGDGDLTSALTGNISTQGSNADGFAVFEEGLGNLTITSTGTISTLGSDADGFSVFKGGTGGLTTTSTGNITVAGNNASGVNAGVFPAGGTAVVNLLGGTVQGGAGTGAGVDFSGSVAGTTNTLNNAATNLFALSGMAVTGGEGDDIINNTGTMTGAVTLAAGADTINLDTSGTTTAATFDGGADTDTFRLSGAGSNTLDGAQHMNFEVLEQTGSGTWALTGNNNFATSATVAGGTLNLNGNLISPTVTNQATLTTGGQGQIGAGTITGNFVQTGTLAADVDLAAGTADRINITGNANLAGTVAPTLRNLTPGTQQVTILSAAGGTTNNGLGLNNIASPLVNAELLFPNATDVALGVTVDFTSDGLNANQTNIANNLSAALDAGGGTLGSITDMLLTGITSLADYQSALHQLSPEVYLNSETASLFAAEAFIDNLFSCPVAGSTFIAEGQCVWVRPEGRFFDHDGDAESIGFDEESYGFSVGAQFALAPNWFAGFAFGYENASLDNDRGAESDSERFSGGGVIKYQSGPILLAAAVSGGSADFDTQRTLASSDHDVDYIAGQARAAYLLDQGQWYVKPMVDLNLTHIDRDGFTETGAGAANLTVGGGDDVYFSVTPAVELGADIAIDKNTSLRPFIRAGATVYEDDSHALTARFAGAPAGVNDFVIRSEFDDVVADIEAGVTAFSGDRVTLSLSYEGHLGEDTQQHGGMAHVSVKF